MIKFLLGKASTGKFRFVVVNWDENWYEPEHGYLITREYGQVHGKCTKSPDTWIKVGKAGRNHKEQAILQFNSYVKGYLDKGYIQIEKHPNEYNDGELQAMFGDIKTNQDGIIKPQLAKQADKVTNPKIFDNKWLISKKLDGVKALFYYKNGEIHTASRGGSDYDASTAHIRNYPPLVKFFEENPNVILDGELFVRGKPLQFISGAARLEKNATDCDFLQYWVYDCYISTDPEMIAKDRWNFLIDTLNRKFGIFVYLNPIDDDIKDEVRLLYHEYVTGWDNMKALHDKWVAEGFEGAVITDPTKPYKVGSRCNNLIKIKEYKSEDFKVIGYKLGMRGSEDMTFTCELPDGRTFEAMPCGTREQKEEYVENFDTKYREHMAECTFFNYSADGIPTQPKLRIFRFDLE